MLNLNLQLIKNKRISLDLLQASMAKALGFKTPANYYKYENGDYKFKVDMLPILSRVLYVPIKDFFVRNNSKTENTKEGYTAVLLDSNNDIDFFEVLIIGTFFYCFHN